MVRTKAGNAAVRKAVAAKAPRKQVASVRSVCSPVSSKSKLSRRGGGGNVIKPWPTPTWQKGIQSFLSDEPGSRETSAGCSSSSNMEDTALECLTEDPKVVTEQEQSGSEEEQIDDEESGSEQEENNEEESGPEQEENDEEESGSDQEESDEEGSGSEQEEDGVQEAIAPTAKLLSDDIATLGSDEDD